MAANPLHGATQPRQPVAAAAAGITPRLCSLARCPHLAHRLVQVHREAHNAGLVRDGARHRLPDPPVRIAAGAAGGQGTGVHQLEIW